MNFNNGALPRALEQYVNQGMQIIPLDCGDGMEYCITMRAASDDSLNVLCERMAAALRELGAQMISLEVFGFPGSDAPALPDAFGEPSFPVTWVTEGCGQQAPLCGIQAWAVTGASVEALAINGRVVGILFESDGVRVCRLGGLLPEDIAQPRGAQTQAIFSLMQEALAQAGMDFSNVLRTWFYNAAMLDWYDEFNVVRTAFFREHRVFDGLVPASTGIGGRNAAGAALTAGLIAVKSSQAAIAPVEIASPLQCSASDYGSSFSRAVEVRTARYRRLYISGTASIAPGGESLHIGDTEAQAGLTMQVIQAILESRGMGWRDVARAIAYFKSAEDIGVWDRVCAAQGIPGMPVLFANTDICRHDLLFEVELDAIAAAQD